MGWEQRLREMILAGGTLVAAACSPSHDAGFCNTCARVDLLQRLFPGAKR